MNNEISDLKEDFLDEAREHVESVDRDLVKLETQSVNPDLELIAKIFRGVHSIKGAAGFLGYTGIVELTHSMETLLHMMRKLDIRPESEVIDALLTGNDILQSMLDDIETSNSMDIGRILKRIGSFINSVGNVETRKKMASSVVLTDTMGNDIDFAVSEFKLENILSDYTHLYLLKFNLHEIEKKKGIKALSLIRNLLNKGMFVDTKIETGALNFDLDFSDTPLMYFALYATDLETGLIEEMATLDSNDILEISKPEKTNAISDSYLKKISKDPHDEIKDTLSDQKPIVPETRGHSDTVRIRVHLLDQLMKIAGEMVLVRNNLLTMTKSDQTYQKISQQLNMVTTELQETVMETRMQPVENLFSKLPRIVRDLSVKLNRRIEIETSGSEVELDKTILEALTDPLTHLIRNACDHGIEAPDIRKKIGKPATGYIHVHAFHEAGQIHIQINDDGKGMDTAVIKSKAIYAGLKTEEDVSAMNDKDIINLILLPGFSTVDNISDISGRGVGMDVVKTGVERIGGSIEIESCPGKGTMVYLRIPLTLAIIPCMIVEVASLRYAIPQINIKELLCLYNEEVYTRIECAGNQEVFRLRDRLLPIVRLNEVLKQAVSFTEEARSDIAKVYGERAERAIKSNDFPVKMLNFAVVKIGKKRYGLVVDHIIGVEEIVVNPMHQALKELNIYSGTTIMGDGSVTLILNVEGLAEHAGVRFNLHEGKVDETVNIIDEKQTVLLFTNGPHEQFAIPLPMIRRVEEIKLSAIEKVGTREFINIDGISTLILRLDQYLNVSPCSDHEQMRLLLPRHIRRPFGILTSAVVDTASADTDLNVKSYMEKGLLGTAIIRNRMTLFIDIYCLIELAEPDWFDDRKKNAPPPEEHKKLLLVEDMIFFRNLLTGYLEGEGYEVTAVENGKVAIEKMGEKKFDLIISDIDMPVMDGWTFMEYVRNESNTPKISAIALTALDSAEDRDRTEDVGFDAYQVKLDREALLINVSELLHR
ncbi:chemotaxis protein CheW [Desulfobacterales bacterium HSG16]|nr:chemotaxis protein CheW [Desulfobacterales bacterium HSG16]